MKLTYNYDIDKIEYYDLDRWFETYINQYKWALLQHEIRLVERVNVSTKGMITIKLINESEICLYLYISRECIAKQTFNCENLEGVGQRLIKMTMVLKQK